MATSISGSSAVSEKLRVAVLYGGRSGEHEVSLQSAASVIRNLDPARFEIIPIGIDKQGRWHWNDLQLLQSAGKVLPVSTGSVSSESTVLSPWPQGAESKDSQKIDVIFPVMHGPLCEDGTIQGLFELADVPYVGCGVLSSAVGMDKDVAKRLARDAGLPIVPFVTLRTRVWKRDREKLCEQVARELGFPVFVKPANMGSSVGVHKVKDPAAFNAAVDDAFRYDTKVLVERAISAREIELSVLEGMDAEDQPLVSVVGEIAPSHEFYSYQAKYLDENGAALMIPAKLSEEQTEKARRLARETFIALECEGLSRVDLFLDKNSGEFYLNEINTLPGFTQISMYPKLWDASGITYRELLTRLIDLAVQRHSRKQKLSREYLD